MESAKPDRRKQRHTGKIERSEQNPTLNRTLAVRLNKLYTMLNSIQHRMEVLLGVPETVGLNLDEFEWLYANIERRLEAYKKKEKL